MAKKTYTDRYLQQLWRQALLILHDNNCAYCGETYDLECHHIIKRRNKLFRHDYRNGIVLCKVCHEWAETLEGKKWIVENHIYYNELRIEEMKYKTLKDYRYEMQLSENKFLTLQAEFLKRIINENH